MAIIKDGMVRDKWVKDWEEVRRRSDYRAD